MALEILSKEYATGTAGFTELMADLTNAVTWAAVDTDDTNAIFRMFNDAKGEHAVGVRITDSAGSYCVGNVWCDNGAETYSVNFPVESGVRVLRFANLVKWEGGFNVHFTAGGLPYNSKYFINIGVCRGGSMLSSTNKWVAWLYTDVGQFVASDSTTTNTAIEADILTGGKFTAAQPLYTPYSGYAPDDVLRVAMAQETHLNTVGYCTWNGKRYYKNGGVLIPAEL